MKKMYIIVLLLVISVFLFVGCNDYYKKKNGKVYWSYFNLHTYKRKNYLLENADYKTFEDIKDGYGKDKNNVYFAGDKIDNADVNTFEVIKDNYGKDKNNVFFKRKIFPNAEPSEFQIIDEDYAKDKNYVFLKRKIIPNADPKTFEHIYNYYSKDKNNVFRNDKIILKADPKTFEKITFFMWKDKNNVFYYDSILPNADPKTMKKVEGYNSWFTDKNAVYNMDNRIDVAPEDFEVLYHCWGRSKTNYYFNHIPMPLDYATTEILTKEDDSTKLTPYIKDKDNVFYQDKKIEGADPKTFVATWRFRAYDANHKYREAEISD